MTPLIDPAVFALAPGFRALSLLVQAGPLVDDSIAGRALDRACAAVVRGEPTWADAHLDEWRDVFRRFGAKPQRTPCSADALRKRVLRDGTLPRIDPVVDFYNAISLAFAAPVGGENLAAYVGPPSLVVAAGTERFDTMKDGQPAEESPEPGEVVWRDAQGVTCRRWNWRQGVRTRLNADARHMWFVIESLPAMPIDALHAAGEELAGGLRAMLTDARIETTLLAHEDAQRV